MRRDFPLASLSNPKKGSSGGPIESPRQVNERQPDFGKPQPEMSQALAGSRKNCSSCDGGTIGDDSTSLINQELQSVFFTKTTKQGANNLDPISTPKPWLPSPSLWKFKKKRPRKGAGPMDLASSVPLSSLYRPCRDGRNLRTAVFAQTQSQGTRLDSICRKTEAQPDLRVPMRMHIRLAKLSLNDPNRFDTVQFNMLQSNTGRWSVSCCS